MLEHTTRRTAHLGEAAPQVVRCNAGHAGGRWAEVLVSLAKLEASCWSAPMQLRNTRFRRRNWQLLRLRPGEEGQVLRVLRFQVPDGLGLPPRRTNIVRFLLISYSYNSDYSYCCRHVSNFNRRFDKMAGLPRFTS